MSLSIDSINSSGLRLLSRLSTAGIHEIVMKETLLLTKGTAGSIYLFDNSILKPVYHTKSIRDNILPRKNGYTFQTYLSQQPLVISRNEIDKVHPERKILTGKCWVFIPLCYEGKSYGVINVLSTLSQSYINRNLHKLLIFGTMASLALKNVWHVQEMENAIKMRDVFISIANHELKTPLTTIMAYGQMIEKSIKKGIIPSVKWTEQLIHEARRQKGILDELSSLDQMSRGTLRYSFKYANILELLKLNVQNAQVRYPDRVISLSYDQNLKQEFTELYIDSDKLTQALINLINNAIRYTESEVMLHFECDDKGCTVMISDHGDGIRKTDIKNLFTLFYRGENSKNSGMGIGLYITKQVVQAHGGYISVDSNRHRGTVFTIYLPRNNPSD